MSEWLRELVLRLMRVPADPQLPDGSADSVRVFRAGKNYYRWLMLQWASAQVLVLLGAFITWQSTQSVLAKLPVWGKVIWLGVEGVVELSALTFIVVSYYAVRLNYELRWYIVTDRSLRIRAGLWSVVETTMTFANLQDLRITAGGSVSKEPGARPSHLARFSNIDNAEALRDLLLERLKHYRETAAPTRKPPHKAPQSPPASAPADYSPATPTRAHPPPSAPSPPETPPPPPRTP